MSSLPKLDIVIVNWNAGPALRECLQSIADSARALYDLDRVVVVDNASSDASTKGLAEISLPLIVIENAKNYGFAAASNQGAAGSRADYVLFLNPDTRLFPGTLTRSVEWMTRPEAARIGILGVQLVDEHGQVARTCARFPVPAMFLTKMLGLNRILRRQVPEHFYHDWDHQDSRCVDQVMGAYFLVRGSAWEELGGFDERFFVYFEEVDLSLRARRAAWQTYFLAAAQCFHRGCGTTDQVKARRLLYSLQSRILYAFKNMGRLKAIGLTLATLFLEPVSRLAQAIFRPAPRSVAEVLHGYVLLWKAMPRILRTAMARMADGPSNPSQAHVPASYQR